MLGSLFLVFIFLLLIFVVVGATFLTFLERTVLGYSYIRNVLLVMLLSYFLGRSIFLQLLIIWFIIFYLVCLVVGFLLKRFCFFWVGFVTFWACTSLDLCKLPPNVRPLKVYLDNPAIQFRTAEFEWIMNWEGGLMNSPWPSLVWDIFLEILKKITGTWITALMFWNRAPSD
jgi:hypothetical protein